MIAVLERETWSTSPCKFLKTAQFVHLTSQNFVKVSIFLVDYLEL